MTFAPDDEFDDDDPIVLALQEYGRSLLPPDFESTLRTFDELMADVSALRAADTLTGDEQCCHGLGTADVRSRPRPSCRTTGHRRR